MKKYFCLLLMMASLYGCSSTYHVSSETEARRHLEDKSGTIVLADSSSYRAGNMHVAGDSISFTERQTGSAGSVALRDVSLVKRTNWSAGMGEGALIGAGGAFVILSVLAEIDAERDRHNPEPSGSAGFIRTIMVGGGTLIGGALGALVGAEIGHRESYVFQRASIGLQPPQPKTEPHPPVLRPAAVPADPLAVRRALKLGIDLGNSFADDHGSFSSMPGYIVGLSSGFDLARKPEANFALGIELNYSAIQWYRPGLSYYYSQAIYTVDKMRHVNFADLGVLPEVFIPIKGDLAACLYLGGSFGMGMEGWDVNERSVRQLPSPQSAGGSSLYGPYWEDNGDYFRTAACGIIGASLYFKRVMIDLRFRNTKMTNGGAYENFYLQAGLVI